MFLRSAEGHKQLIVVVGGRLAIIFHTFSFYFSLLLGERLAIIFHTFFCLGRFKRVPIKGRDRRIEYTRSLDNTSSALQPEFVSLERIFTAVRRY